MTPVDITVESEVQVMSEPPKADILLLRRQGKAWSEAQRQLLPDGVRDRQAQHHLLECKFSESFNEDALQQAVGYDYFYRQSQQLKGSELQTYIVSAKTPRAAVLESFGYYNSEHPGVYVSILPLAKRVVLLVLNELSDAPHNEFLRLFASRQQVRQQTIGHVLQQAPAHWPEPFWSVVFGLQRVYQLGDIAMSREMTVEDVIKIGDELRKQAIASASPDEISEHVREQLRKQAIASASLDEISEHVRKQAVSSAPPEDRLAGLAPEDRLAGLAPDEMALLHEQIEALLAKQSATQPHHRTSADKP